MLCGWGIGVAARQRACADRTHTHTAPTAAVSLDPCTPASAADRKPSMANIAPDLHRARAVLVRLEQEVAKLQLHPGE